jgi:serine/threonine protein kinase
MFGKLFGAKKVEGPRPTASAVPKGRRVVLLKRFSGLTETGKGSMSTVYRAVDLQVGRAVCLKVQDAAKTAAAMARSGGTRISEGEIASGIHHENVVRTFDWGYSTKGEYFIVMEYIEGVSLNFIRESRGLALPGKLDLLAQAADGLAAVHAAEYIHRDFGPKNLLIDRESRLKIIDFGLAVPNTDFYRRPGNRTGTLAYMAPELVRRETTDERLDIFSFGVTAFEFLTGRQPYDVNLKDAMAVMRSRINANPIKIEQIDPKLPPAVCDIINRTLAKRPIDRWPAASSLGQALRDAAG